MEEMESTEALAEEISYEQIQVMMDELLGEASFDFSDYISGLLQGRNEYNLQEIIRTIWEGAVSNLFYDKKLILCLIVIAVIGALFSNFSKLLQGKQVASTAFFTVYLLFFSVLSTAFAEITGIASQTLENLLEFIQVLVPSFFISMSFSQGGTVAAVYYEFTLSLIAAVNFILVNFAIPAINLYFFLQVSNYLAQEDMFSKMAELIRDFVKFIMKTLFGIVMGMNVIQGLIVPISAQVKNMAVVRVGGSIPGIGSVFSSVAQSVLCAGTLLKNAVGVTGLVVVFLICAVPLVNMICNQFLLQVVAAAIQPVSDKRLVKGISGAVEAVKLLIYAVGVGAMLFITSIALISVMTNTSL